MSRTETHTPSVQVMARPPLGMVQGTDPHTVPFGSAQGAPSFGTIDGQPSPELIGCGAQDSSSPAWAQVQTAPAFGPEP